MQSRRFDSFLYSGSDIPGWFSNQSMGASITMQFPSNMDQFKAIAFCIVFEFKKSLRNFGFNFDAEGLLSTSKHISCDSSVLAEMDSVVVWRSRTKNFHEYSGNAGSVTFRPYGCVNILDKKEIGMYCKIKKCGICLLQ